MNDIHISVSDINSFLRCRRSWDIGSPLRQGYRHKVTPKLFFMVGSAVHEAIDAQARGEDYLEAFDAYVQKEREDRVRLYKELTGSQPWANEFEEFEESVDLARGLVEQYFDHYGSVNPTEEQGLEVIATEIPFKIPLSSSDSQGDVYLVGTFDAIYTDIETRTRFYLGENKTASSTPDFAAVSSSNQFVGYNWAFQQLTGIRPAGTLYNLILKRLIKEPKVLKSGKLSTDKRQSTTAKKFFEAIQAGGRDPLDYVEFLAYLEEQSQNDTRFFRREMFYYTQTHLAHWERDVLRPVVREMTGNPAIYPNLTSCNFCSVKDVCESMFLGEDTSEVLSTQFEKKSYGTHEAVQSLEPVYVTSTEELIQTLKGV